jgi:hypothetical protein
LRSADGRRLAKRFYRDANGRVRRCDFDNAFMYETMWVVPSGIYELHGLLQEMESALDFCLIRGAQRPECDATATQRCKAMFAEVPRRYVLLDVDGVDLVPGLNVLADPEAAARIFAARLVEFVPELAGVSVVVRWSSSAGTMEMAASDENWSAVAKSGVSAHVWCWLASPRGEAELVRWVRAVNQRVGFALLDEATCRTVQPMFTSAPVFDGMADPLAGQRTILVRGDRDEANFIVPPDVLTPQLGAQVRAGTTHDLGDSGCIFDNAGRVTDGRDAHLSRIAFKAVREAEEAGIDPHAREAAITDRAWDEFEHTTDLSRHKRNGWPYTRQDAAEKVHQKLRALQSGTLPATTHRTAAGSLALPKASKGRR